jgi:hypothetical protein
VAAVLSGRRLHKHNRRRGTAVATAARDDQLDEAPSLNSAVEKGTNADILEIVKAEWDVGTSKKAFQINLDAKRYGTFAEIGAGQEVARRFFYVGGVTGRPIATSAGFGSALCLTMNTSC